MTFEKVNTELNTPFVKKVYKEINEDSLVQKCLEEIKAYDEYTYSHCDRVCRIALNLGQQYFLTYEDMIKLGKAAILHDIGKTKIDHSILNKPDSLTKEEYKRCKDHVMLGCLYLTELDAPKEIISIISEHHERGDGSGYPFGRSEDNISLLGRIVAVSDVFDAVTVKRIYQRKAMTGDEAIDLLINSAGIDDEVTIILKGLL